MNSTWPGDKVERRPVASLIYSARNSRTHSDAQIDQIAASIREWGFTNPILIDEDSTIIAGHGRAMASKRLGLTEVPTITARGWSDAQKRAYIIADNKLSLNSGWNEELLALELSALDDDGFNLELVGFDAAELDDLFSRNSDDPTDGGPGGDVGDGDMEELPAECRCPKCGFTFSPEA